jgi:OPA family glycerol-3-phosphate transporter-like MFS transporter
MTDARTRTWQRITLATLFVGYAGYYICRSNLSVATPMILKEFASSGMTKKDIGTVTSVGLLLYSIGKVTNGLLVDFFGGRILFLLGMVAAAVCTVLFGLAGSLLVFTILWAVNRYVQSVGWGALVKVTSRWYPVSVHATVMGILCMSYLLGDSFARLYLGMFIARDFGWRSVFFIAAGTLGVLAALGFWTLKSSPRDIGGTEPPANPDNVFGAAGDSPEPEGLIALLWPLATSLSFWLICLMNAGLTLIRETFNFWMPTYLAEVGELSEGGAAQSTMLFPLVGAVSAFVTGAISDRVKRKRGRLVLPALIILSMTLTLLGMLPLNGRPIRAIALICAVFFVMIGPYSLLSGVMALDLGGKRGSSTAVGFIDSAGYLGGVLSGYGVGAIAESRGWSAAFLVLAATAAITSCAAAAYWAIQERGAPSQPAPS